MCHLSDAAARWDGLNRFAAANHGRHMMIVKKTTKKKTASKAKAAKKPRATKATPEAKEKKLSALDAAAKVLTANGEPMTTKELIDAMSAKGYWTSPGGKTPERTLFSALTRDIAANGKESRFKKGERGQFLANKS
jgi:hypothetical protein